MTKTYITIRDTNCMMIETGFSKPIPTLIKKGVILYKSGEENIFTVQNKPDAMRYSINPSDLKEVSR